MAPIDLPLVTIIATGGTIASRKGADGASIPDLEGRALLERLEGLPPVRVQIVDLFARDSSSLGLAEMQAISDAVGEHLANPAVAGIVVLHGTDSMEETSLLVALQHGGEKPVAFTGAQFTDDHPQPDGPSNMSAAIQEALTGTGTRVVFGGRSMPVWGIYKHDTTDRDAFRPCNSRSTEPTARFRASVADLRIDLVAIHPGGDGMHIRASLDAGSHGIVLAALGSGNATADVVAAVSQCTAAGIPVVVSSRVPTGRLSASYGGGGGGHDLQAAGAILSTVLRPGQARILLASLVADGQVARRAKDLFAMG